MNKQQKIIVSIVGITIVLLALLGITYAYYLTRIEGNTNTNSISITTADLKLEYGDGNGIITATNIMPGDTVGTKTFTVTNKGNATIDNYGISLDYAEIVKDNKIVVPSIFERPEDFEITLTCKDNKDDDCNGYTGKFNNESIIMTISSIEPNEVHSYSLSIYYANPDIDQSNDMGKNLNLKVNIFSVNESADINGTITGVDSTYALKVNSEPKLSTIVDGKYSFKGIEVGTHTLSIIDNNGNVVKSQKLVIETGDNPGISETTVDNETVPLITINENSRVAPLNTTYDKTTTTITNTGTTMIKFNPYENNKDSLSYHIIANSQNISETNIELGYAVYRDIPSNIPGKELTFDYVDGGESSNISYSEYLRTTSPNLEYYYTYADSFNVEYDEENYGSPYYILYNEDGSNVSSVQYSTGYQDLVGKYVVNVSGSESSSVQNYEEITYIYYIVDATSTKILYKDLSYGQELYDYYIAYGDSYEFDPKTGKYSVYNSDGSKLKNVKYVAENFDEIVGKYTGSVYNTSSTVDNYKNLYSVYKVDSNLSIEGISYKTITKKSNDFSNIEKTLSYDYDDYGTSYYYRGGVSNNYLNFAGMCWRIVRIQGDGSIRLFLEDKNEICSSSMDGDWNLGVSVFGGSYTRMNYLNPSYNSSTALSTYLKSFQENELSSYIDYLKYGDWCIDDIAYDIYKGGDLLTSSEVSSRYSSGKTFYYSANINLVVNKQPSFKCPNEYLKKFGDNVTNMYVGTLTADEAAYAGGIFDVSNKTYYLVNNYQKNEGVYWWTFSPRYFDSTFDKIFAVTSGGSIVDGYVFGGNVNGVPNGVRPAITLKTNTILLSGDGTISNPYVIQ